VVSKLEKQVKVQLSEDNHRNMVNKFEKGSTTTKLASQQHKLPHHKKQQKVIEDEKIEYSRSAHLNLRRPHIKNIIGYKMGDKHNSRVNNNGKEFIKFIKANAHQEKQDNKATNHVSYASKFNVNVSHIPYHVFYASYVLMRNKFGKVIAMYVGPHHKRPKTCVQVPKTLVTNMRGPKQVGC
jgi:hypothetical protein